MNGSTSTVELAALGHPVGVTGNRLILTALKELHRRREQYALVSLCIGGGQGGAIILERASRPHGNTK